MRLRERFVLFGVSSDTGCSSSSYERCFENRVRALLAQHSVKLPENESLYTKQGRAWLDQVRLPDSDAHLLHGDCKLHDDIEVQIASTDTLINKLAALGVGL